MTTRLPGIKGHLLRIFGLGFGFAVVIGGVIGSGIMRNPSVVAAGMVQPKYILLAWLAGGLVVAIDAMPTVELASAIPKAGGAYSLVTRAIGPRIGLLVGWADWMQLTISTGFISVAFGEYVHRLGFLDVLSAGQIAILLVLACASINWAGTETSGVSQNVGSALKGLGLLVLVAILFLLPTRPIPNPAPPPQFSWIAVLLAMRAIYGAYGGWQAAVYFSEEVRSPEHNIVRATFGGIALVTTLYLLVNSAVLHVLPIGTLARSNLAASDAAAAVVGPESGIAVTALAILCVATLANLQIMEQVRTTYAMARLGALPPKLTEVSTSGTPRRALTVVVIATSAIIAVADVTRGHLYEVLLNLYAPFSMIVLFIVSLGSVSLRTKEPGLIRPWSMPFFPLPAAVSMVINGILLGIFLMSDWKLGIWSALLLAISIPLYRIGRSRWRQRA